MAGKHSKKLFGDTGISVLQLSSQGVNYRAPLSLPFKIIIAATVLSLVLSMIFVGIYFVPGRLHNNMLQKAADVFEKATNKNAAITTLAQKNSDIKAWLKIDGTNINCAVCQSDSNTYYLNHNQNGKRSRYGALFLSSNDSFERKGNDQNIVIYGNNMKNGSMFGSLKKYRNLNFYKQNPTINLYYKNESQTYIVFSVMLLSSSADDGDTAFNPTKSHFGSTEDFNAWYNEVSSRSLINTTVKPKYNDNFLTLVTVANDFDGARLVVIAKQVTEWDASHTDVTGATVNANIKYPEIWYSTRGLEYPH